jgi:actin-binding LIM protein
VPIKIRKSRLATLKTGMQRLTEDLDKNATPRAKSPHMDNEEPIELSHYPGAHEPDPNEVPPIERENFPAPPFTRCKLFFCCIITYLLVYSATHSGLSLCS